MSEKNNRAEKSEKRYKELQQLEQKLEEALQNILEELVKLPKGKERWDWFSNEKKKEKEEICIYLLEIINNQSLRSIKDEADIEKEDSNGIKGLAVMEALKETLIQYEYSGTENPFLRKFRQNYKHFRGREMGSQIEHNKTKGMVSSKNRSAYRLIRYYGRFMEEYAVDKEEMNVLNYKKKIDEDFKRKMLAEHPKQFSEKMIDDIIQIHQINFVCQSQNKDGEDYDLLENIAANSDNELGKSPENIFEIEADKGIKREYFKKIFGKYNETIVGIDKTETREVIRAFLTRDILKALKLEQGKDKNGKEETKCPNKHRYTSMPAGEKDVYELLQQYERVCMEDIFVENYINVAVKEVPESLQKLYGIYYNLLKDDFKFIDTIIGKAIYEKDKSKVSRYRKEYERFKSSWKRQVREGYGSDIY